MLVEETRGRWIQRFSLSSLHTMLTDQNGMPSRFRSLCHQITHDKQWENCLIDEQSNSLHVINTPNGYPFVFHAEAYPEEGMGHIVIKAPN